MIIRSSKPLKVGPDFKVHKNNIVNEDNCLSIFHKYNLISLFNHNDEETALNKMGDKKCLAFIRGYKCCHNSFVK